MIGRVPPMQEDGEGNGIHLWYTRDAELRRNDVSRYQDSIYLSFADRTRVTDNLLHDAGRYGLHTMYCQDNHLTGNRFTRNVAGCAIMFSNHLQVIANDFDRNRGPRTYGLLLKDCSGGMFRNNRLVDNTIAVFMDNSNRNRIEGNLLVESLDRSRFVLAQTPQGFSYSLLARAHREAADAGLVGDDDAQLVAATGHAVTVVEGEPSNVKLTTPEDFGVVEALIKEQETAAP